MKKFVVYIEDETLNIVEIGDLVFTYNNQYRVKSIYHEKSKFSFNDFAWSMVFSAEIYTVICNFSDTTILINILDMIDKHKNESNFATNILTYIQDEFPEYCL